jgi:hypothetical protein
VPDLTAGDTCKRPGDGGRAGGGGARRRMLTVNFRQPSHEFTFNVGIDLFLTTGTNPPYITSSLLHVDLGVYCLRRKSTLKRRLSG